MYAIIKTSFNKGEEKNTMKRKILIIMAMMVLGVSGCNGEQKVANNETAVGETSEPTFEETTVEKLVDQKKADAELPDSLEEYLSEYQDSATYHLLYDYALNENADGSPSNGVNYMFVKDSSGKRIEGSIMAFYTSPDVTSKDDSESYIDSFMESYFSELVPLADMSQDTAAKDHWIRSYYFDDYVISFIPESNLDGVTVALSKVNN